MRVFRVFKKIYNYDTETFQKEYLPEYFTSVALSEQICSLHKQIDGGIYLYEPLELGKCYNTLQNYKKENKEELIKKRLNHIKNNHYIFDLLQANDFGDFILTSVWLTLKDMDNIIDKFNKTTKQSIQIHNHCFSLIKVKRNDLVKIIEKKQEIDSTLKKLEAKLGLKQFNTDF